MKLTLLVGLAALFSLVSPRAMAMREAVLFRDVVRADDARKWSETPGDRDYVFRTDEPYENDLEALASISRAGSVTIEMRDYPGAGFITNWQHLTRKHETHLVLDAISLPTPPEIDRLNRIGAKEIVIELPGYPGIEEAQRLPTLHGEVSLQFRVRKYPEIQDRPSFRAIPANIPVEFRVDIWPNYSNVYEMNKIPNPKRFWIYDLHADMANLENIFMIEHIDRITAEVAFEPQQKEIWRGLSRCPDVRWVVKDGPVPSASALSALSSARTSDRSPMLVIDREWGLNAAERSRLQSLSVASLWIHPTL